MAPASIFSAVPPHLSLASTLIPHQPCRRRRCRASAVRRPSPRPAFALPAAGDVRRRDPAAESGRRRRQNTKSAQYDFQHDVPRTSLTDAQRRDHSNARRRIYVPPSPRCRARSPTCRHLPGLAARRADRLRRRSRRGSAPSPLPYNLFVVDQRLPGIFKLHMLASGAALLLIPPVIALRRNSAWHRPLGYATAVAVAARRRSPRSPSRSTAIRSPWRAPASSRRASSGWR